MCVVSITIKKLGMSFERDTATLPQASVDYLLQNGFSQRLRDVHASVKRTDYDDDEQFEAAVGTAVAHALDQIDSGDVPGSRQPGETAKMRATIAKLAEAAKAAGVDVDAILG